MTKEDIKQLATRVFDDTDKAKAWLNTPLRALNNHTPASRLDNTEGLEEVGILLRKIETGEFI